MRAVLDRAFDPAAVFTAAEVALVEPISRAIALPQPADEIRIERSIGSLAAALPSQATDTAAGKLKLRTYVTMLAGCDERALAYACRRCLDELDWMPTIHQLKERMAGWVGEDAAAIVRAKAVMRAARAGPDDAGAQPLDAEQVASVNAFLERKGLRTRFAADGTTYMADDASSAYVPQEEAA